MFSHLLRISFVGLLAVAVTAWASSTPVGPSSVQGDVKDSKASQSRARSCTFGLKTERDSTGSLTQMRAAVTV